MALYFGKITQGRGRFPRRRTYPSGLSNHFRNGEAKARLEGQFMGQGPTLVAATFRREKDSADFDLNLQIKTTPPATQMNDLLRAHGGFDVVAGSFSLFSEISVRGRYIDGYVKPFFKDLDVYDPRQEKKREWLSNCRKG